jgi:hypothetical protein
MTRRSVIAALAALALAGCRATSHGSVDITELCFPPTPDDGGACAFDEGTCSAVLADGSLRVDLLTRAAAIAAGESNYLEYPLQIDNFREDNSDATGRTNTNFFIVERFDMKYEAQGLALGSASTPFQGRVEAGGAIVAVANLIPKSAGDAMAAALPAEPTDVIIKVKAHGHFGDDTAFDTAEFQIPVSVRQQGGLVWGCATGKTLTGVCPQQGQTAVAGCK